jgi:Cft2 family RNA processing exonuclease
MRLSCCGSGSSGNSYILESDNEILILDAGISPKTVLPSINFQISKISGVLVTHSHS